MARSKSSETEVLKDKEKSKKPKSLKIEKKVPRERLNRLSRKARLTIRDAVKRITHDMNLKRIPNKLYKKVDTAIANDSAFPGIIETAVCKAVNEIFASSSKPVHKAKEVPQTEEAPKKKSRKAKPEPVEA